MNIEPISTASLRMPGLRLLGILATYTGPETCADISDHLGANSKSVRQNLCKLIKRGFVRSASDGERVRYSITSAGRAYLAGEGEEDELGDELDNFPRPDSSLIVQQAMMTQPTSVFDLARMMQR